jgi:RHS repeat-associated protein
VDQTVTLPANAVTKNHWLVVTDRENFQGESNDLNNVTAVNIEGQPDLVVSAATVPTTATWGSTIPVSWTVSNIGPAVAMNEWYDYVYASSDDKLDASDTLITTVKAPQTLARGASYTISQDLTIPTAANDKPYLLFATDRDRQQVENNEINNVKAVKAFAAPDLKITTATTPTPDQWGSSIPITWTVKNDSTRPANSSWYDYIYASADSTLDATDLVVAKVKNPNLTPLAGGDSYTSSINLTLPARATNKPYLFVVVDGNNDQIETTDSNNSRAPKATDWLHVATVLDPTQGMQLYINGKLQATAATSLRRTGTVANTTFSSATAALSGQLDNVSLWNVAKTATEIQSDFQKTFTGTESGLLSYWQAEEGVGTTITDTVSGTKTGTLNGTTWAGYSVGIGNEKTPVEQRRYTYDAKFNQLTSATDELGHKTLYNLDSNTGNIRTTTRVVGQLDSAINGETDDIITSYTYTTSGQVDTVTDALLHITDYDYDPIGNLTKTTTAKGTIDETVEEYKYDNAGNITTSIDALQRQTKYVYNSNNNMLLQTIDALGGSTTYNYDKMGHQTRVLDALGHETKMTYDDRGRLISTLDAAGGMITDGYDNNGNLIEVRRQKSTLRSEDLVTKYQYDARNRLTMMTAADESITRYSYDPKNNLSGSIDALNHQTKRFYDSRNRLIRTVDGMENETKYTYNAVNQLIATTDAKNHTTTYKYDELGRLISTKDALGNTTRTEYDKLGNITATIDANGNRTEYTYDALNRRIQVKDAQTKSSYIVYNKVGDVLSTTDRLGHTTNYGYDALNRQTSITDALNQTTSISYNKVGNILTITDPIAGHTTSYGYDQLNRKTSTTDALNQTSSVVYNILGNISSSTDELGRTTSYEYDKVDRLTTTTDALLHTTKTSYDKVGNILTTSDGLEHQTSYLYDKNNRRIQVTDAKLGTTKTDYDAVGNVNKITDSVNNSTTYSYDEIDRLITDTNQLGKSRTRSYDAVGNLIQTVDRNGRKVTYQFNNLNRETAEHWLDNSGTDIRTFNYSYDAVGHLLDSNDPDSHYRYTYDAVDRVTAVDNLGTAGVPNVLLNYSYDAAGNLLSVADKINGVQKGTNAYAYDLLNRATRITQSGTGVQGKRVDLSYDAASQMTGLNRYGDLAGTLGVANSSYSYDAVGRLTNLTHQHGTSTLASYGLVYDAANRITKSSGTDGTQNYTYDSTNQLTGANHTTQADEAYSYDANGNRTSAGYGTGTNNQLLTDGVYNYTYDDEGNRTKRTEISTGKVTEYVWDYRNRLAGVLFKDAGGVVTKTIEYLYDVNDRRIGKKIDGAVSERYVYDGSDIALVFDGAGSQTHRYLYGTGIDQVLADERGGAVVWALGDNQGTIRDLVDGNGTILNHINYDSFGRVVSQTSSSVEFRFGYTGREADAETGLDYYRARYYDSSNGRFISEDPIGFAAGDTNLTRYVGNSPTNFIDPSGRQCSDNPWDQVGEVFGEYVIKPLVLTGLAGIKLLGDNATTGLNNVRDYFSHPPEGSINPSPPPFPNPNNDRLRLGNNQVEGYPSHPIDIPPLGGFDLTPVPTTTNTGGGYQDYSGLSPQFLESQNHHGIPWNNNTYDHGNHPLVAGAGANLKNDPRHQIDLENHAGRHSPSYHDEIQIRMDNAYNALPPGANQADHDRALGQVMNDVLTDIRNGSLRPYDHKDVWEPTP